MSLVHPDETVAGFRWALGGGQEATTYSQTRRFGKALGNGFAVSALTGREFMQLGEQRTRARSAVDTHGAETHRRRLQR
jgi:glutamate-1-semialdehyde aminotransferase